MSDNDDRNEIERLRARVAELEQKNAVVPAKGFSGGYFGCFGVFAAVVTLAILVFALGQCSQKANSPATSTSAAGTKPESSSGTLEPTGTTNLEKPTSSWTYSASSDAMHDTKTQLACTTSTNEVQLSFPYHDVNADLCIRKSPRFGLDAYVQLNGDGQILCDFESCTLHVRFDTGVIRTFPAAHAADGSSNIIFINNTARFIAGLRKSSATVVEVQLYQAGNQDLTFTTKGFSWP